MTDIMENGKYSPEIRSILEFYHPITDNSIPLIMADALGNRAVRQVYLVTYSQADLSIFPDRRSFSEAVIEAVNAAAEAPMMHWVCAQERHQDGGMHFHMAFKLGRCQRWLAIRDHIEATYGINVHFSNRHSNYFTAWKYVCKEDEAPLQSDDHPDLSDPPRTQAASQSTQSSQELVVVPSRKRKRVRMSNYDFSRLMRDKKLKSRTEVLAFASMQEREGKSDLAEFIFNRSKKALEELIQTSLDFETAEADLERSKLARVAILEGVAEGDCVEGCAGAWYAQAEDILNRNHIAKTNFAGAIFTLLEQGRGKYRNILLTGPANCGKTFLISPLGTIFKAFTNPASTTFAWVGVEDAEVILLNDFRWSPQVSKTIHIHNFPF